MGLVVTLSFYFVLGIFTFRIIRFVMILLKTSRQLQWGTAKIPGTAVRAAGDILFFLRLFRTNKWLWVGSWLFHLSFLLVMLKHIRYFLEPVPFWVASFQPLGKFAGYILPLSLFYILILRLWGARQSYLSRSNLFLTVVLLVISVTGLLMATIVRQDLPAIKYFVISAFDLRPDIMPESLLFALHFLLFLLLMPYLPSHIFTAPVIMLDARRREDGLDLVLHEK